MTWETEYAQKIQTADQALQCVQSGMRVYIQPGCAEPETLDQIGARLGITRERSRQIKEKALARLRKSRDGRVLSAFYKGDAR